MFKNLEDLQQFSKDQLDAATVTATTLSKGAQQIAVEATDYSKKSLEVVDGFPRKASRRQVARQGDGDSDRLRQDEL